MAVWVAQLVHDGSASTPVGRLRDQSDAVKAAVVLAWIGVPTGRAADLVEDWQAVADRHLATRDRTGS